MGKSGQKVALQYREDKLVKAFRGVGRVKDVFWVFGTDGRRPRGCGGKGQGLRTLFSHAYIRSDEGMTVPWAVLNL